MNDAIVSARHALAIQIEALVRWNAPIPTSSDFASIPVPNGAEVRIVVVAAASDPTNALEV